MTKTLPVLMAAVLVCIAAMSCHTTCGDGYCDCYKRVANCKNRGLTFIPRIPPYVRYLYLSQNNFTRLSGTSFANVSVAFIVKLDLDDSNLSHLSSNTFQQFTKLRVLDISGNPLIKADLAAALTNIRFRRLNALSLNRVNFSDFSFVRNINAMYLKFIELDGNDLYVYNQSLFSRFRYLKSMSVKNNQIHKVHLTYSKNLNVLLLQGNFLTSSSLPKFCNGSRSLLPKLHQLVLNQNFITEIDFVFECLPGLQNLQLSKNPINVLRGNTFSKLPNLKILLLGAMLRPTQIMAYTFNNSNIEKLILANNHINFDIVHSLAFKGLKNLKVLTVSANRFQYVSERKMIDLFGEMNLLEAISMGDCSLRKIPKFLSRLKSLKTISLYRNIISSIPENSFQENINLTRLGLDENRIPTLHQKTLLPSTLKRLMDLNLSKNPFICDCSLQWFIAFHKNRKKLFSKDKTHYLCSGPANKKGQQLKDIRFSANECYLPFSTITAVLGVSALIITVIIICSILYKMRWNIRHFIYMRYHRVQQEEEQLNANMRNYTYDAFIIHSEEDEDWVVDEMIPCLENNHHLRLCVANRDFQPGMYILANIDIAIQTSRTIIVVLSPSFVESEWCQTEVTLAQSFVLDARRRPLLTVVLEEPDARNMRHSLHLLLRSSAYIMWGEEQEARRLFWRSLVESL